MSALALCSVAVVTGAELVGRLGPGTPSSPRRSQRSRWSRTRCPPRDARDRSRRPPTRSPRTLGAAALGWGARLSSRPLDLRCGWRSRPRRLGIGPAPFPRSTLAGLDAELAALGTPSISPVAAGSSGGWPRSNPAPTRPSSPETTMSHAQTSTPTTQQRLAATITERTRQAASRRQPADPAPATGGRKAGWKAGMKRRCSRRSSPRVDRLAELVSSASDTSMRSEYDALAANVEPASAPSRMCCAIRSRARADLWGGRMPVHCLDGGRDQSWN